MWTAFRDGIASVWSGLQNFVAILGSKDGVHTVFPTMAFMLAGHLFFWITVTFLNDWTSVWYAERHPVPTMVPLDCAPKIPAGVCVRLQELSTLASGRAAHHYEISRVLQSYEFGFLSTAYLSGTLLALSLFSMIRQGFDDLGSWGKGMLLGFLSTAAFFGGFPSLVQLDRNVEANLDAYNAYDGITNEVRTYLLTGQSTTGNHVDGFSFLHKIDLMLTDLPAPRLQFDASQVDLGKNRFMELSQEIEGGITPFDEGVLEEPLTEGGSGSPSIP